MNHSLLVRPIIRAEWIAIAVVSFVLIVALPIANAYGLVSDFSLNLWGKYLC